MRAREALLIRKLWPERASAQGCGSLVNEPLGTVTPLDTKPPYPRPHASVICCSVTSTR